jgi:hypothetical protein
MTSISVDKTGMEEPAAAISKQDKDDTDDEYEFVTMSPEEIAEIDLLISQYNEMKEQEDKKVEEDGSKRKAEKDAEDSVPSKEAKLKAD